MAQPNVRYPQLQNFTLSGAGATVGDTTLGLASFTDIDGTVLSMDAFGTKGFGTIEPGSSSQEEQISFTGITQNANGTATLTGVKTALFIYPYTETSGLAKGHAGGVRFTITNTSGFYNRFAAKDNDETVTGQWTVPDPIDSTGIANKQYVLSVVNGGAVSVNRVVVEAIAGETVAAGNLLYLKASDGRWWKTDADTSSTVYGVQLGIAQGAGTAGNSISTGVLVRGYDSNQSGLTSGTPYYVSNTAGAISASAGTNSKVIGQGATSATTLYFDPDYTYIPTPTQLNSYVPTGTVSPYAGRTAPSSWLLCDGSAVSRTTYADLFSIVSPSQTFTVTVASPAVFTATAHGLAAGDRVSFTTTGALPTGLSTATEYFVLSTGLTSDNFRVALSPEGTVINTSGSQSGTHTVYKSAYGMGDGSTTFNVPDLRARTPFGLGASTQTLKFEAAAVNTGTDVVTIPDYIFPAQGQAVVLTTTGALPTGLSLATTYYIIRASSTTIKFAASLSDANSATAIDLTAAGSGVTTMTFTNVTNSIIGQKGGEETHGISTSELASHTHGYQTGGGGISAPPAKTGNWDGSQSTTGIANAGGNAVHNNMSPFIMMNYIIKT